MGFDMSDEKVLQHYGIIRRSGRYPWGSGGDDSGGGRNSVLSAANTLSKKGFTEKEIAKALGMSTLDLRNEKTLAKMMLKEEQRLFVQRQRDSGMSTRAISAETGIPESTVRSLLRPGANAKFRIIKAVSSVLKKAVDRFGFVDIGEGVELYLGVSDTKLRNAVSLLEKEGYTVHYLRERQLGTGKKTSYKILAGPDATWKDVRANRENIQVPNAYSLDNGQTFTEKTKVNNVSLSRIKIVTGDQGGAEKDGLIELRRTPDLDMGPKRFAQVRIGVEETHYLKGMAVHPPNMPPGKDIVFYTSKTGLSDPKAYLKEQELDGHSPFGATISQRTFKDSNGKTQLSAVNVVNEEGDWSEWDRNLATQFLGKQSPKLAKGQLDILYENHKTYLDDIKTIPNPTVRAHLLGEVSDNIDKSAVHLKAAALPRQTTSVIVPGLSVRENEVFAPNYRNGEQVVLVRYPHGGVFEIPNLKVNNKNSEMRKIIGPDAPDAIGINPKVAKKLSGADFDGDFVLVIPNPKGKIRTAPALEGLKNFDPIQAYPKVPGMKPLTGNMKDLKMGDVSNLITDMTVQGAPLSEIARAVRHSMVVIDAEKHELNWKQSHVDNGIAALKKKYQGGPTAGASTLLSQTTSPLRVPHREEGYRVDPKTGAKVWRESGQTYVDKAGKIIERTTVTTKGAEKDPFSLSSGTVIETVYANHANRLKALANDARKEAVNTKLIPRSSAASKTYKKEVASLESKFNAIQRNKPLERKAQLVGGVLYREKKAANPNLSKRDLGKERDRALATARIRVGMTTKGQALKRPTIDITPREWEAINMNALSPTRLKSILRHADPEQIRTLSLPSSTTPLPSAKESRARVLLKAGYTTAEVADAIGASQSQILGLEK
jgi:hypothetical protein